MNAPLFLIAGALWTIAACFTLDHGNYVLTCTASFMAPFVTGCGIGAWFYNLRHGK